MVYIDEAKRAAETKAIPSAEMVRWAKIEAETMERAHETRKSAKRRDPNRYPHYEAEWNAECACQDMRALYHTLKMRANNNGLLAGEIIDQLTPGDIFKDWQCAGCTGERWVFEKVVQNTQWGVVNIYYFRRENGAGRLRDIQEQELSRAIYNGSFMFVGKPAPTEPEAPKLENGTFVIVGTNVPHYAKRTGRVVNCRSAKGSQVFVLLDNSSYAQEFDRSEVAIDPRYTPEAIEEYRTINEAITMAADEAIDNANAAITVAEKRADAVYIDNEALRSCMGLGATFTTNASERLVLSRFLDYLEANRYAIGEYGKSEGGGSPLCAVDSATEIIESFLHPRR